MNIFFVDSCPIKSAIHLHNRHCVKMVLESAQLLSTVRVMFGDNDTRLYKPTHVNHPSTKWIRTSLENYLWLLQHFVALLNEYTYRYGRPHACLKLLQVLALPINGFPEQGLTKFALAMPDEFKVDDPVQSYRNYYLGKKIQNNFWTKRKPEELDSWLTDHLNLSQFKE